MHILIYITFPSKIQATEAARTLIDKKLIACANIMSEHDSVYEWEGKLMQEKEVVMLAKTRSEKFEQVRDLVLSMHSSQTPCIIAIDIEQGDESFLSWIDKIVK